MATFQVVSDEAVLFTFRADFTVPTSTIHVCNEPDDRTSETPFRVSDSRRRPVAAARLVNGWCRTTGRKCWAKGTQGLILRRVR